MVRTGFAVGPINRDAISRPLALRANGGLHLDLRLGRLQEAYASDDRRPTWHYMVVLSGSPAIPCQQRVIERR